MSTQATSDFEGVRENPELTIARDELTMLALKRERIEILSDLLNNDWVESGGLHGYYQLVLKLDAVVYEEAAITSTIGRDFRVKRVSIEDDGHLKLYVEILEWECLQ